MKKFVGLCACTMGLAHTFMAAQSMEDEAKKRGYEIYEVSLSEAIKDIETVFDDIEEDLANN